MIPILLISCELMHDVSILHAGDSSINLRYINVMKKNKKPSTYNFLVLNSKDVAKVKLPYTQDMGSNYNVEGLILNSDCILLNYIVQGLYYGNACGIQNYGNEVFIKTLEPNNFTKQWKRRSVIHRAKSFIGQSNDFSKKFTYEFT